MLKNIKSLFLLLIVIVISCTESNATFMVLSDDATEHCTANYPNLTDSNYTGTICCIQRNSTLNSDSPVTYEYFTNLSNPQVVWEVVSGDIEITAGSTTNIVTLKFGKNFQGGKIKATGSTTNLICSGVVNIIAIEVQH